MAFTDPSFILLDSVDSTNNYAMAKAHAGLAKHGDAFFASNQTGGKGQRGKKWHTGNGENIALSIVTVPAKLSMDEQFKLSAVVALGCFDFFSKYAGDETKIKWPNDIYWRDRKAGGILIENIIGRTATGSHWKYAVVGIGINVNDTAFENELKNAVSLKQITGKHFDVVVLAKQLHQQVLNRIAAINTIPFEAMLQEYNRHLYKVNEAVQLKKGNIAFNTIIKAVTENGQLATTDTVDNYFDFGEVEWML
jgi:BirA family transcriptional regulator, biotin operon repressor / biotin---[acetyl-CoA-carboxylase] ligase